MDTSVRTVYEIKGVMMGATTVGRLMSALKEFPQDAVIQNFLSPGPVCWDGDKYPELDDDAYTLVFESKRTHEQGEL